MSRNLSFKEALAQREGAEEESPASSDSLAGGAKTRFLLSAQKIDQPVQVVRTLRKFGMPLRSAHAALNRLAAREIVAVEFDVETPQAVIDQLGALGVMAATLVQPAPDVRKIREAFGLSQSEFAIRFGLELDTVRNWEQGRNQPDPAARLLLKIIETSPAAVESVLVGRF
jgi:DNA-binding XRE family transcriptional regulator